MYKTVRIRLVELTGNQQDDYKSFSGELIVAKGIVKWFNNKKGYGFILHEKGDDFFVHYSSVETEGFKSLNEGQPVHFEVTDGPKGLHATNVVPE